MPTLPAKNKKPFEKKTKFFQLELKELNDRTGEVEFYFASWKRDMERDRFIKTAYDKTLSQNQENIYHNRDHADAVGKPIIFVVDEKGVFCKSQLAIHTINGKDCYEQYKAGLIKGHSQEFETILDEKSSDGSERIIKEVRLWGVTSVTNIPANLDTPTISVKSLEDAADQMKKINNLLLKGNASDKLCESFLKEYDVLAAFVKKHSSLNKLGVIHCGACKHLVDPARFGEEGKLYAKCPTCGRFINVRTGAVKSFIYPDASTLKDFKLSM